ncbi:MFS transporter [Pseudonocardia humida]|uniref:MFS transporter n=1 Tax=Pseudonocardia humida TaxID=2800819 RepID=A0ABT1A3F9_9PSEU|nr:MFS transporter [Pseudonocardia humida]MCO1657535.1 MFS transporter [Pseudonocardia humida]
MVEPAVRAAVVRVAVPGAALVAVTFGLARYGYGLLLPDMRAELGVGPDAGGVIASGSYASYLVATAAVVWLTGRFGARVPLGLAAVAATAGMVLIARATGVVGLAVGVALAGTAAGLAFPPYADVIERAVPPRARPGVLSAVSSGTGWGVAVAGPIAIVAGEHWRTAWLLFAGLAAVAGAAAVLAAPRGRATGAAPPVRISPSWLVCPRSRPLLVAAALVGAGSSVWWTFGVDALVAAGLGEDRARAAFALCGAAGVLASGSGALAARLGLRRVHVLGCVALAGALALLGLAPGDTTVALLAAAAFGVTYNGVIAAQGLWSAEVFRSRPSAGLAAVNTALTIGTITGPAAAGLTVRAFGHPVAMVAAAGLVALAVTQAPPRPARS